MQFDELLAMGDATHAIRWAAMRFWSGRQQALRIVAGHETDVWMPGEAARSALLHVNVGKRGAKARSSSLHRLKLRRSDRL
jgi:hypothetical protein